MLVSLSPLDVTRLPPPGFHPSRVLPVVIDVGTNNAALRNDPLYLGLRHPRIVGAEYIEIIDEVRGFLDIERAYTLLRLYFLTLREL